MFKKKLTRREFGKFGTRALLGLGVTLCPGSHPFAFAGDYSQEMHEARFYRKLNGNRLQCQLCYRRCVVKNGHRGFCRNRENRDGTYYTIVYGKPSALQIDPIEKEPCYHMWPGTRIFCTGTASCNNRCQFCHNWHLSQRSLEELTYYEAQPEDIVNGAEYFRCESLSFTKAPLLALLEHMDAVTVDLKAFTDKFYRTVCSSRLDPVLKTLINIRQAGKHLEVVNLIIPTLNDDLNDVRKMCRWILKHLGEDTPVHFSRFYPNYKLLNLPPTPIETLEGAHKNATEEGLNYVTIGNVPGHAYNSTFCPRCKKKLIYRIQYQMREYNVVDGKCKFCKYPITGIWY